MLNEETQQRRKKHETDEVLRKFDEIFWPLRDTVLRTARFLIRNSADADDLAQETMIKAFRFMNQFQPGTDAKAWLLSILRNTRIDRLRSAAKSASLSLDHLTSVADQTTGLEYEKTDDELEKVEDLMEQFADTEIIEALQTLPEEIRWTLLLVDVEELEFATAARIMNIPVGTVKSRAHRGRTMLKEKLVNKARDYRLIR
ncbi:MAG: ECF RNA polymerase sigma factor SigH [Phycisphaerae bacterium]|jgi:RNA polymerase sigma-70 factor (ECF subfamily)|nr:MAG: ECF RNA polymerase sigma factor SigH [Phycisphaerae bacterium]